MALIFHLLSTAETGSVRSTSPALKNYGEMVLRPATENDALIVAHSEKVGSVTHFPGDEVHTLVLLEQGGKTTITQTVLYESREAREAVLKSGMESGIAMSYHRLAELLASTLAREGK